MTLNRLSRWLAIAGGAVLLWTLILALRGSGWSVTLLGLRLSSRDPYRSLVTGGLLASIGLAGIRFTWPGQRRLAICAGAAAAAALILGVTYGTYVAASADTYGYVSQADLWITGSLVTPTPLASEARWRDAEWAMTPLGYRPALRAGFMVPIYPMGLPLTMAATKVVVGDVGAFVVSPLLGALTVWLTFLLGRALHGAEAGVLAAFTLLVSPIFLFYLMVPMSDVPVTAWWLGAVVLALKPDVRWRLVMSGVATAIALLTRPNLVLLTVPMAMLVIHGASPRRTALTRLVLWGIPASIGAIGVATFNMLLYGSPLTSGYGALETLYSPGHTWTNLKYFGTWLLQTQTPFVFLGVAAASWRARWCLAFALCVLASYVWYTPFDHWTFLRFLLPALPMLLATAAATLVTIIHRYDLPDGVALSVGVLLVCVGLWQGRETFSLATVEARYRAAADMVSRAVPPDAVVICNEHSGSIRSYAGRTTLRFEWLGEDEYDGALRMLREHGHASYVLLDGYEVATFRGRYARVTDLSWLDRLPLGTIDRRVFLYEVP